MSKKHHMTKLEFKRQNKQRRQVTRQRDGEEETLPLNRVLHGRIREKNLIQTTHQIRSIRDIEDDFLDLAGEDDELRA